MQDRPEAVMAAWTTPMKNTKDASEADIAKGHT